MLIWINVFLPFECNIVSFKFKWALLCSLVNCFFATRTTTKHVIDRQPWLSANVMLLLNLLIKEKQSCFTNELSTGGATESIITLIVRHKKSTNHVRQIKIPLDAQLTLVTYKGNILLTHITGFHLYPEIYMLFV